MDNKNDSDARLIIFLRNLADSIDKKELVPKQKHIIGEFFMKYQFQQQAILANDNSSLPKTQEEMLKFIVFAWYVYCCILTKDPIQLFDDEEEIQIKNFSDVIAPVD